MMHVRFSFALSAVMLVGCSTEPGNSGGHPAETAGSSGAAASPTAGSGGAGISGSGAAVSGASASGSSSGGATNGGGGSGGAAAGGAGASAGGMAGGNGGTASGAADPSTGCSKPATQALNSFVRYTVMAQALEREYFVRLPENYVATKPYRLIFTFPGCGGKGEGGLPLYNQPMDEAIYVGPSPDGRCFVYEANSKDVAFFDEMLKVVEDSFCVDKSRVFTTGHSSGSYFSNTLGCTRSNVLRAQGNIAGGLAVSNCLTNNIAGILIHDHDDPDNSVTGGIKARDRLIALNGCSMETKPVEPSPCVEYQGCKPGYPVIWCETTTMQGHSRQDKLSVPAIYNFFAQF